MFLAIIAIPANAQFKWGVEGGVNLSKIDVSNLTSSTKTGFFIGPKIQFTIPVVGLMIDASAQYSQSSMDTGIDCVTDDSGNMVEIKNTKTLPYIVVPVNLKYGVGLGSAASVYLSTGPQWNYFVGSSSNWFGYEIAPQSSSMFWNVGVGLHLLKHLQLGVTYNIAMGDNIKFNMIGVDDVVTNLAKGKNNIWQVRLAYMF